MDDSYGSVKRKVLEIFRELTGDRAERLCGGGASGPAIDAITTALAVEYGADKAWEIAFHMADWNWDAAFVVALHLFPERFTAEEIRAGLGLFLGHAPNHIRAACQLTDECVWTDFSSGDERTTSE